MVELEVKYTLFQKIDFMQDDERLADFSFAVLIATKVYVIFI